MTAPCGCGWWRRVKASSTVIGSRTSVICAGCGQPFEPVRPHQSQCRPSCRVPAATPLLFDLLGSSECVSAPTTETDRRGVSPLHRRSVARSLEPRARSRRQGRTAHSERVPPQTADSRHQPVRNGLARCLGSADRPVAATASAQANCFTTRWGLHRQGKRSSSVRNRATHFDSNEVFRSRRKEFKGRRFRRDWRRFDDRILRPSPPRAGGFRLQRELPAKRPLGARGLLNTIRAAAQKGGMQSPLGQAWPGQQSNADIHGAPVSIQLPPNTRCNSFRVRGRGRGGSGWKKEIRNIRWSPLSTD